MQKLYSLCYKIYVLGLGLVLGIVLIFWCYLVWITTALLRTKHWRHRAFYYATKNLVLLLFFAIGIRIREHIKPRENFETPAIFIANHTSYLDSLLILLITNHQIYPLGKSEIGKIPILGFLYKHYVVPLNREKLSSKKHSFVKMQNLLKAQKSIFIFPEGGFKDEPDSRLEPFTMGAFRLATEFQIPIYPILFINTRNCFQFYKGKLQIRPGQVKIQYLSALIPPQHNNSETLQNFREQAFTQMYEALSPYAYPL